jgi:hypothetical protein
LRVKNSERKRCSGASRRALERGQTLKSQPSFTEDGRGSRSRKRDFPRDDNSGLLRWATRRMRQLHADRRDEAGKHDIPPDGNFSLL